MNPLFAFKYTPNYKWGMTVGPVTLAWQEWSLVLLVCSCVFAVASAYLAWRYGRWWLTIPIAIPTALSVYMFVMFRIVDTPGGDPHSEFEYVSGFFLFTVPLIIIHAVVSFTMPRRKPPAEPPGRYNSP